MDKETNRISLTYNEYVESVRASFESLALGPLFDIPKEYVDECSRSWIENHSLEMYYTYLAYILKLPAGQEHIDKDGYLFSDAKEIFISLIGVLFEIGYYDSDKHEDGDKILFILDTVDEIFDKVSARDMGFNKCIHFLEEEYDRRREFNEKVSDET